MRRGTSYVAVVYWANALARAGRQTVVATIPRRSEESSLSRSGRSGAAAGSLRITPDVCCPMAFGALSHSHRDTRVSGGQGIAHPRTTAAWQGLRSKACCGLSRAVRIGKCRMPSRPTRGRIRTAGRHREPMCCTLAITLPLCLLSFISPAATPFGYRLLREVFFSKVCSHLPAFPAGACPGRRDEPFRTS